MFNIGLIELLIIIFFYFNSCKAKGFSKNISKYWVVLQKNKSIY